MNKAAMPFARLLRVSTTRTDGGAVFGPTPKEQWESFISPDRQNRVALGNYSMLLAHPDGWVLVNAGPGDKAPLDLNIAPARGRSSLLRELRDLGITPKDIAVVIMTHLHDEHAGGGTHMTSSGRVLPSFPNARYIIQRAAYEEALAPNERSARHYRADDVLPLEESGQLELAEGPVEVVSAVWVEPAPGPAAGHQMVVAGHRDEIHTFLGALVPTALHLTACVTSAVDRDPQATMHTKRNTLGRAALSEWKVGPVGCDYWVSARELGYEPSLPTVETAPVPSLEPVPPSSGLPASLARPSTHARAAP